MTHLPKTGNGARRFGETASRTAERDLAETVARLALYFDVFAHPLTLDELATWTGTPGEAIEESVTRLVSDGVLARHGRYICTPGAQASISRRTARNRNAERIWPSAHRAAKVLAHLPFVQGVFVTGGLSKNAVEPDADIDFLLIVEPGTVWTVKSMTQLFRKSLPNTVRECFCTNYIVAADQLAIPEQTMFTAVELTTAVPMYGPDVCRDLIRANQWAERFIPDWERVIERAGAAAERPTSRLRRLVEHSTRSERIDSTLQDAWTRFWDRKYSWVDGSKRAKRFKRERGVSTNHLNDYQSWVLAEWKGRLEREGIRTP